MIPIFLASLHRPSLPTKMANEASDKLGEVLDPLLVLLDLGTLVGMFLPDVVVALLLEVLVTQLVLPHILLRYFVLRHYFFLVLAI